MKFIFSTLMALLISSAVFADDTIPAISFTNFKATALPSTPPLTLEQMKGNVIVMDFWASWCEPCKEALPHYNKLSAKFKGKNVIFMGINEDDDVKERDTFLKQMPVQFSQFTDKDKELAKTFGVQALPTLYVLDKKLKPVFLYRGFNDQKPQALEKKINELLKSKN